MSQTCPNCGFLNKATNRFCSNCGGALVPAPAPSSENAVESGAVTQPVTYVVQRWDANDAAAGASGAPTQDSEASAQVRPTFVPYGGYGASATTSPSPAAPTVKMPVAPTPAAPPRGEGGMYAPYSAEVARKLETKKPQRSWLVPSVAAAGLLLLVLVVIGGILLFGPKNGSGVSGTTPGDTNAQDVPAGMSEEDIIKSVIKQSNDEQIKAWQTLDIEVLKGTRTGQVLDENIQAVQDLKSKDMYAIPVNKSLEFGEIKVDGDTATAKTVEVWTVTFYSKGDNRVVLATGPDTLRETYYFVKQDGKWLVTSLDIEQQTPSTPGGTT